MGKTEAIRVPGESCDSWEGVHLFTQEGAAGAGLLPTVTVRRSLDHHRLPDIPWTEEALGFWAVGKLHKPVLSPVVRCLHGVRTLPS